MTPLEPRRHPLLARDFALAAAIFAGYLALLVSTMQIGFTRDEGYYFHAAQDYWGWFEDLAHNRELGQPEESFTQANIDRHWGYNPEHPVLMKTLFALSWHELSQEHRWLSPTTAMRFPAAVLAALMMALVFLFVVEATGSRSAALLSAIFLGFMPHVFFHSHLACFDVPMTFFWFLVVYAYWRSLRSRLWAWLTGVFFGLALITKLNAFFIPVPLVAHWLLAGRPDLRIEGRRLGLRLRLPPIPRAFVAMSLLGPLIFYLAWPLHWFDTFNRVTWYIARHLGHENYFVEYFGHALIRPPFPIDYPVVVTLLTVPVVTLLAALLGSVEWVADWLRTFRRAHASERDRRGTGWLVLINLGFPIFLIALPSTPVFGGTKHWMESMPFLAVLAGVGAARAFSRLWGAGPRRFGRTLRGAAWLGFCAVLTVPIVHATFYVHPVGSSYFNELAGGIRGSAELGMMRQFWGDNTRLGLDLLNHIAPPNARVFPHDANGDDMAWYRTDGLLRADIRDEWAMERADYLFFNHQRAFVPVALQMWRTLGTVAPMHVWTLNGVPELSLYGNAEARATTEGTE